MPKYIDAERFAEHISGNLSWNGEQYNTASAISDLRTFPAADVEPVVRCENCQFFEIVEYWPDGTKKVCQLLKRQVQENSFCCWGMKKEADA